MTLSCQYWKTFLVYRHTAHPMSTPKQSCYILKAETNAVVLAIPMTILPLSLTGISYRNIRNGGRCWDSVIFPCVLPQIFLFVTNWIYMVVLYHDRDQVVQFKRFLLSRFDVTFYFKILKNANIVCELEGLKKMERSSINLVKT